jgi:hypothetical protein
MIGLKLSHNDIIYNVLNSFVLHTRDVRTFSTGEWSHLNAAFYVCVLKITEFCLSSPRHTANMMSSQPKDENQHNLYVVKKDYRRRYARYVGLGRAFRVGICVS